MWFSYRDHTGWHRGRMMERPLYTTIDLYRHAMLIFNAQPQKKKISHMGVSSYHLSDRKEVQLSLFEADFAKARKVSDAADKINDIYGEFTVVPGIMMHMDDIILDRIAFGGMREMEGQETSFMG